MQPGRGAPPGGRALPHLDSAPPRLRAGAGGTGRNCHRPARHSAATPLSQDRASSCPGPGASPAGSPPFLPVGLSASPVENPLQGPPRLILCGERASAVSPAPRGVGPPLVLVLRLSERAARPAPPRPPPSPVMNSSASPQTLTGGTHTHVPNRLPSPFVPGGPRALPPAAGHPGAALAASPRPPAGGAPRAAPGWASPP